MFGTIERDELIQRLKDAGIAFGEVNDVAGLSRHPALRRSEIGTPTGPAQIVAPPATIDGETRALGAVPEIGEQTDKIRREFAS